MWSRHESNRFMPRYGGFDGTSQEGQVGLGSVSGSPLVLRLVLVDVCEVSHQTALGRFQKCGIVVPISTC